MVPSGLVVTFISPINHRSCYTGAASCYKRLCGRIRVVLDPRNKNSRTLSTRWPGLACGEVYRWLLPRVLRAFALCFPAVRSIGALAPERNPDLSVPRIKTTQVRVRPLTPTQKICATFFYRLFRSWWWLGCGSGGLRWGLRWGSSWGLLGERIVLL